MDFWVSSLVP
jgi:hypothetical protein